MDNSFKFEVDFDTQMIHPVRVGRFVLFDQSIIDLYFGPKGLMAHISIPQKGASFGITKESIVDDQVKSISYGTDEVHYELVR